MNTEPHKTWTVAEAKARLSEILRLASKEGPQRIGTKARYVVVPEEEWLKRTEPRIPLGRWGKVEEVGQLALYLCTEEAGFITGTDILIDGGWCAQ